MIEEWRAVMGAEGYEVSNQGRVRSYWRTNGKLWDVSRLLTASPDKQGYLRVGIVTDGKVAIRKVYHLVLEAFVGPCPDGMQARHFPEKDKSNNRLDNLSWGTPKQNQADRRTHGTASFGEKAGLAKLRTGDAIVIQMLCAEPGITQIEIARAFKMSTPAVHSIKTGRTWRHATGVQPCQA